jgi:hypothetical protein
MVPPSEPSDLLDDTMKRDTHLCIREQSTDVVDVTRPVFIERGRGT